MICLYVPIQSLLTFCEVAGFVRFSFSVRFVAELLLHATCPIYSDYSPRCVKLFGFMSLAFSFLSSFFLPDILLVISTFVVWNSE